MFKWRPFLNFPREIIFHFIFIEKPLLNMYTVFYLNNTRWRTDGKLKGNGDLPIGYFWFNFKCRIRKCIARHTFLLHPVNTYVCVYILYRKIFFMILLKEIKQA